MKNLLVNPIIHVVAVSSLDHSRYRFRTVSLFFSSVVRYDLLLVLKYRIIVVPVFGQNTTETRGRYPQGYNICA